jgi:hypothetical protein
MAADAPQLGGLTNDQAITLRRVAFGESDVQLLRRADIERLLQLRLITVAGNDMALTDAGRKCFDSLPRGIFAMKPIR